jgi:translation elongation factor EF-1alpha
MKRFLLCGQTDSGKSTIAGHILYKCGYFDERRVISEKKSKWSELLDEVNGELGANKSKTIYFTELEFEHNGSEYVMFDTPGHHIYIRQLVSGLFTTSLSAICLVVSSIQKEFVEGFEKGTVKEDLLLARSTGCSTLFVLFNKIDVVEPTQEMIECIRSYAKKLRYKDIRIFPLSGYTGTSLLSFLECIPVIQDPPMRESTRSNTLTCTLSLHTTDLITAGYRCNLHMSSGEYQVTVDRIRTKAGPLVFVKGSDPVIITFTGDGLVYSVGDKVVLRNSTETIGFGVSNGPE